MLPSGGAAQPIAKRPALMSAYALEDPDRVEMMVEISPFLIQGRFCGAVARYAPFSESVVLSTPPDDMGMTLVYAVP